MAIFDIDTPPGYSEPPNSIPSMGTNVHNGLIVIGTIGVISLLFTSTLLGFMTWRMLNLNHYYTSSYSRNQSVILIYQLILADSIQASSFIISLYWASQRQIAGPKAACFTQGFLVQLGDVASASFVLAIAAQTVYHVIFIRTLSYGTFVSCIVALWGLSLLLSFLAPIIGGRFVFLTNGVWCWISREHKPLGIALRYAWVFIVELFAILCYGASFYYVYRGCVSGSRNALTAMLAYAIVYTTLSTIQLLRVCRMAAMAQVNVPENIFLFAGALFTCSGWVDCLLYALTRRSVLFDEPEVRLVRHQKQKHAVQARNSLRKSKSVQRYPSACTLDNPNSHSSRGIQMERTVKVESIRGRPDLETGVHYASVEALKLQSRSLQSRSH